jgi:hypothetical protein
VVADAGRIIQLVRIRLGDDGGEMRRERPGSGSVLNWKRRHDTRRSGNADGE